jgi:hypothetical protein
MDRDDFALRPNALGSNLRPTSWRGARVEHTITATKESLAIIDVDEFVRRARAIALFFRETKPVVLYFFHRRPSSLVTAANARRAA